MMERDVPKNGLKRWVIASWPLFCLSVISSSIINSLE